MTALAAIILWAGCVGWSLASAVGFAATSREDVVAVRQAHAETRHGWQATVRRSEKKLTSLQTSRPANVILAEINKLLVPANIWRRTRKCTDVTVEASRLACAKIQSLRTELASARAAEKLENDLEAARAKLDTAPVSGSKTDPQAAAIAGLLMIDEDAVRNGLALLIAVLVEAGSALGFTITILATSGSTGARQSEAVELPPATSRRKPILAIPTDAPTPIEAWAAHRLDIAPDEEIPAMVAYENFVAWCRDQKISPWTITKFGREFKVLVRDIGGDKEKRRDRRYYRGVALNSETRRPAQPDLARTDLSHSQSRTRTRVAG